MRKMSASIKKMDTLNVVVQKAVEQFKSLTQNPEDYLEVQTGSAQNLRDVTKAIYDLTKNAERGDKCLSGALPNLITEGFDDEQVWQEIDLQNEPVIKHLLQSSAKLGIIKPQISFNVHIDEPSRDSKSKLLKKKKSCKKTKKKLDNGVNKVSGGDDDVVFSPKSSALPDDGYRVDDQWDDGVEHVDDQRHEDGHSDLDSDSDKEIARIKSSLKRSQKAVDATTNDSSDSEVYFNFPQDELEDDDDADNLEEDDTSLSARSRGKKRTKDEIADEEFIDDNVGKASLKKAHHTSIVDDKFFHLSQMERFLEQEDTRELKKQQKKDDTDDDTGDDDNVDMFAHLSSDEEVDDAPKHSRSMKYEDFFDAPEDEPSVSANVVKKSVRFEKETQSGKVDESQPSISSKRLLDDTDDDSEGEDVADILGVRKEKQKKSTFEKRQEKLKEHISQMEDASLVDKPWQLKGEASATSRPENSLLEEHLQFDHTARLPPVVTEETTKSLEDIIQQRIKDKAWDDVERKIKPTEDPVEYKKRITLNQEKSKLSLGEIYEQEYLKQQQAEEDTEVKKDDAEHEEIKKLMRFLFTRLDALSNFHYTPKPAIPELQIVSNQPSIRMEEVAPVSVTDAQRLAPEELEDKQKGELKGMTEKSITDRKRERREKKASKRIREKEKRKKQKVIDKLHPGLGNKYSKEKAMKDLEKQSKEDQNLTVLKDSSRKSSKSSFTSSKAFFTHLQQEVTSQISKKKSEGSSGVKKKQKTSKHFKL